MGDDIIEDDDKAFAEFAKLKEGSDYVDIGGENVDAKESNPKYKGIIKAAEKEAEKELKKRGVSANQLGYCHYIWAEMKRILKEKYGVEWRTPAELNPGTIYD